MKTVGILSFLVICVLYVFSATAQKSLSGGSTQPAYGSAFDEIVVNSSLNIKKKGGPKRQVRSAVPIEEYVRVKRQHHRRGGFGGGGFPGFDSSASAANAQAQSFQSGGPFNFGASAANSQTQGFSVGRNGIQGSAGLSGSQSYNLPNGKTLSLAYSNGFAIGPDGRPVISRGNSIAFNN